METQLNPQKGTQPTPNRPRNATVDIAKFLLALMVVGIHSPLFSDIIPRAQGMIEQGIYRIAVPCFFVFTGFHLAPSLSNRSWRPWLFRIVALYVFWTLLYAPAWYPNLQAKGFSASALVSTFVVGYWHLWYLPALIFAVLMLVALHHLQPIKLLALCIVLTLIGTALQYAMQGSSDPSAYKFVYARNGLFFAFPFLAAGYLLRETNLAGRVSRPSVSIALCLALILLVAETAVLRVGFGVDQPSDLRAALLVAAPLVVLFVLTLPPLNSSIPFGPMANGIYFLHVGALLILSNLLPLTGTALTLVVILISGLVAFLLVRLGPGRLFF